MAIQMGGSGRSTVSDINMTPMIDVLLVLLVIFMIAQPLLQKSIDVQIPKEEQTQSAPAPKIVLEIGADGNYLLNTQPVPRQALGTRLREIYSARPDKVLFLKADEELIYQAIVTAMDIARGAGVEVIGTANEL